MADCKIVGYLDATGTADKLISIKVDSSTEVNEVDGEIIQGPTIGNISITGYAQNEIAYSSTGGGSASVSINWVQKYDCDNDLIYLLFAGGGKATVAGDVGDLASVANQVISYNVMDASIAGGPSSPYFYSNQNDGYGLEYSGGPISFTTSSDEIFSLEVTTSDGNIGTGYLKSFNLNYSPGTIPTASYNFIFAPNDNMVVLPNNS